MNFSCRIGVTIWIRLMPVASRQSSFASRFPQLRISFFVFFFFNFTAASRLVAIDVIRFRPKVPTPQFSRRFWFDPTGRIPNRQVPWWLESRNAANPWDDILRTRSERRNNPFAGVKPATAVPRDNLVRTGRSNAGQTTRPVCSTSFFCLPSIVTE